MNKQNSKMLIITTNDPEYIYYILAQPLAGANKTEFKFLRKLTEIKELYHCHRRTDKWRLAAYHPYLTHCRRNLQFKTLQQQMVNTFGIVLANVTVWWINKWRLLTTCKFGWWSLG
jgi:hypothetical protein